MSFLSFLIVVSIITVVFIICTGIICYRILNWVKTENEFLEFIKSVIIQDHEDICNFCESNIIEGCSNTQFFQCEGRYCEDATEMYFEDKTPAEIKEEYYLRHKK